MSDVVNFVEFYILHLSFQENRKTRWQNIKFYLQFNIKSSVNKACEFSPTHTHTHMRGRAARPLVQPEQRFSASLPGRLENVSRKAEETSPISSRRLWKRSRFYPTVLDRRGKALNSSSGRIFPVGCFSGFWVQRWRLGSSPTIWNISPLQTLDDEWMKVPVWRSALNPSALGVGLELLTTSGTFLSWMRKTGRTSAGMEARKLI